MIQHYDWGSRTALAGLLGRPVPSPDPEAELWLGAHPNGPSEVRVEGRWERLDALIEREAEALLGPDSIAAFGRRLPFLLKVLAVERPLSLQAHPDAQRAAAVFAADRGLPADRRRYLDPHGKPELICALTPFAALCGLRPFEKVQAWLASAGLIDDCAPLEAGPEPQRAWLAHWLRMPGAQRAHALARLTAHATVEASRDPIARRVCDLAASWPGDPGLIAPVLLHEVRLAPGEALFLRPGQLHCYLSGCAVEIMAASDNVVRAGLTRKPIDVEELLEIVAWDAVRPARVEPAEQAPGLSAFPTSAGEFELSRLALDGAREQAIRTRGPELLLCLSGSARVATAEASCTLGRGDSCVIPAAAAVYSVSGNGVAFRAALPAGVGAEERR